MSTRRRRPRPRSTRSPPAASRSWASWTWSSTRRQRRWASRWPPKSPPDAASPEPPIEALDTVEHELPSERDAEPAEEPEPSEREPEAAAEGEEASEQGEAEHGDGDQEDDMLADTPEFLRDAPEDDELWFEQGKPKDFDF